MEKAPIYLIITLLAFYFLMIPSNAIPSTRVQRLLLQEAGEMPSVKGSRKMAMEQFKSEDDGINARMVLEIEDYAPSGANNHHTPKPPGRS